MTKEPLVRYVDEVKRYPWNDIGAKVVERAVCHGGVNIVAFADIEDGAITVSAEVGSGDYEQTFAWELTQAQTLELVGLLTRYLASGSFVEQKEG